MNLAELLAGDPVSVAPHLLGGHLTVDGVTLRLTEVEAYAGSQDPGSHAYRGPTPRTGVMFGPAGHLYVYFTYGMHWCANVVCDADGTAGAVLLRAGEVTAGQEVVARRRPGVKERDWARGPARLTKSLSLTGEDNSRSVLSGGRVSLALRSPGELPNESISSGPRVGVSGPGGDGTRFPWRFWFADNPTVSRYRPGRLSGLR